MNPNGCNTGVQGPQGSPGTTITGSQGTSGLHGSMGMAGISDYNSGITVTYSGGDSTANSYFLSSTLGMQ